MYLQICFPKYKPLGYALHSFVSFMYYLMPAIEAYCRIFLIFKNTLKWHLDTLAHEVLLVIWIIGMYNGLVKAKIKVDNSWSDIQGFSEKTI